MSKTPEKLVSPPAHRKYRDRSKGVVSIDFTKEKADETRALLSPRPKTGLNMGKRVVSKTPVSINLASNNYLSLRHGQKADYSIASGSKVTLTQKVPQVVKKVWQSNIFSSSKS